MSFLKEYCDKKGLHELWTGLAEHEECLVLLASEKLWDDVATVLDSLEVPRAHRPLLKVALIKMTRAQMADALPAPVPSRPSLQRLPSPSPESVVDSEDNDADDENEDDSLEVAGDEEADDEMAPLIGDCQPVIFADDDLLVALGTEVFPRVEAAKHWQADDSPAVDSIAKKKKKKKAPTSPSSQSPLRSSQSPSRTGAKRKKTHTKSHSATGFGKTKTTKQQSSETGKERVSSEKRWEKKTPSDSRRGAAVVASATVSEKSAATTEATQCPKEEETSAVSKAVRALIRKSTAEIGLAKQCESAYLRNGLIYETVAENHAASVSLGSPFVGAAAVVSAMSDDCTTSSVGVADSGGRHRPLSDESKRQAMSRQYIQSLMNDCLKPGKPVIIPKGSNFLFRTTAGRVPLEALSQSTLSLSCVECTRRVSVDNAYIASTKSEPLHSDCDSKDDEENVQTISDVFASLCDIGSDDEGSFKCAIFDVSDICSLVDASNWSWDMYCQFAHDCGWGPLVSNKLTVCTEGVSQRCHLSEFESIVVQAEGCREMILFPPSDFDSLFIDHFPSVESRLDLRRPWSSHCANGLAARELRPHRAVLRPGDVIYVPSFWCVEWRTLTPLSAAVAFRSAQSLRSQICAQPVAINLVRNVHCLVTSLFKDEDITDVLTGVLKNEEIYETHKRLIASWLCKVIPQSGVNPLLQRILALC